MEFVAHRGEWTDLLRPQRPNTLEAFCLALEHGFGVEVDIRDRAGELVISHNPAQADAPRLEDLLSFYRARGCRACMAFNVKADGLQPLLKELLRSYGVTNYFTFDMSIPNTLEDARNGIYFFVRQSEYEPAPASLGGLYADARGVWADQFAQDPGTLEHNLRSLAEHWAAGKRVCWVSAELHPWGREKDLYQTVWAELKNILHKYPQGEDRLLLCTDYPAGAKEFFYGKR